METLTNGSGLTFYHGSPWLHGSNGNMIQRNSGEYINLGAGDGKNVYGYRAKIKMVFPKKVKNISLTLNFAQNAYLDYFMCGISETNINVIGNICRSGMYGFHETYLEPYIIKEVNPLGEGAASGNYTINLEGLVLEAGTYYIYLMCANYGAVTGPAYAKINVDGTKLTQEDVRSEEVFRHITSIINTLFPD